MEDGLPATKEDLLKKAREDIENGYAQLEEHDLDAVTRSFARSKQDCDVNLSHRQISELPEELIDIIKDGVTRLALHRNHLKGLSGLTLRIPECTKLKYLALRNNEIREFPKAVRLAANEGATCSADLRLDSQPAMVGGTRFEMQQARGPPGRPGQT